MTMQLCVEKMEGGDRVSKQTITKMKDVCSHSEQVYLGSWHKD